MIYIMDRTELHNACRNGQNRRMHFAQMDKKLQFSGSFVSSFGKSFVSDAGLISDVFTRMPFINNNYLRLVE